MKGGKFKCSTADTIPFRRGSIGEILADFLNERQRGRGHASPGNFFGFQLPGFLRHSDRMLASSILASDEALQIGDYYYYFLCQETGKKYYSNHFPEKKNIENLTDFRKTVETGVDPRLPFLEVRVSHNSPFPSPVSRVLNNSIPPFTA